jgi:hypothetical protein
MCHGEDVKKCDAPQENDPFIYSNFFIKSINDRNIYDDAKRKRDVKNVKGICEYSYRFLVRVYTYTPTIAKIWVPCHTVLTF